MKRALLIFIVLTVTNVTYANDEELKSTKFLLGLKVGAINMHESRIVDSFTTILLIKDTHEMKVKRVIELKKEQINSDLLALYSYLEEIKDIHEFPEIVKITVKMSSPNTKVSMGNLRDTRDKEGWTLGKEASEQSVQRVFQQYEKYGNLFAIE
jgi:hypothetical protein